MKIGIDIDGVIVDLAKFVADYGAKFCYENQIPYQIHSEEYDEQKALGITSKQAEEFWNCYLPYYATNYLPREFAIEVMEKLRKDHELFLITARNEDGLPQELQGKMQEMVKKWLEDNRVPYDHLIFSKGSKLPYCIQNEIEVMIEDSPINIEEIAERLQVLCFDNPYNRKIEHPNVIRVYSWYDILNQIQWMEKR